MTAYEIIGKGFALAGEYLDMFPDKQLAITWLNVSLAESLVAENHIRQYKNTEQLSQPVVVKNLSDNVDFDIGLCSIALPYGLASYLSADREDSYMSAIFRNRFVTALQNVAKARESTISDLYGGA